jgi:hypothetical protein
MSANCRRMKGRISADAGGMEPAFISNSRCHPVDLPPSAASAPERSRRRDTTKSIAAAQRTDLVRSAAGGIGSAILQPARYVAEHNLLLDGGYTII